MTPEKNAKPWVKDLLVAFAATTLSIVLTFGTSVVINRVKQVKERKLTAMMVMSSIETYARFLEQEEQNLAYTDSVYTWLLSLPIKDVAKLGDEYLLKAIKESGGMNTLTHDQTAETIFSSNIDTWKNMGNFQFIDNVGSAFSLMNKMEEYYNEQTDKYHEIRNAITDTPNHYPGDSMAEKFLRDEEFRAQMTLPYYFRRWLLYSAATLREMNRKNMALIGITEKEVMDFTDDLGAADEGYQEQQFSIRDFGRPQFDMDSLKMQLPVARKIDSLLRVR